MLVIGTDTDCSTINRIEIKLSRGSQNAVVSSLEFARAGCPPSTATARLSQIPLGDWESTFRLGVVDGRRNDDRLYVEVLGKDDRGVVLDERWATDFDDNRVTELAVNMALVCLGMSSPCPAGQTCKPDDSGAPTCVDSYIPSSGLRRVQSSIQASSATTVESDP